MGQDTERMPWSRAVDMPGCCRHVQGNQLTASRACTMCWGHSSGHTGQVSALTEL